MPAFPLWFTILCILFPIVYLGIRSMKNKDKK